MIKGKGMLGPARKIARILGSVLAYAYKPRFSKSLKPYAQSRARMAGFVATVFQSLGVLDPTHPLSRDARLGRARLRDLVAHAWSRTNWKQPLGSQSVLVLSITLLLLSGGIAMTSFAGSIALHVGKAEAQMFTAPSQATDLAMSYIMRAFGIDTQGHTVASALPGQGPDMLVTAFKTMMAAYSTAMLVLGGFILLYIIVGMIAGTAHEGRFGGSGFNQVWAPLRLVMAVGLLIPIGAGGYNSGQYIILQVAQWGSALASNLWVNFADTLAARGQVIATGYAPSLSQTVAGTLKSEICMTLANLDYALSDIGAGPDSNDVISVKRDSTMQLTGLTGLDNNVTYTYSNKDGEPICGKVTIPQVPASPGSSSVLADKTSALQLVAYDKMVQNMRATGGIIDTIKNNRDTYLPANRTGLVLTGNMNRAFTNQLNKLIADYQTDVDNGLAALAGDEASAANDAMSAAVRDSGWAGAASWFNTIARLNAEYHDRVSSVPTVTGPSPNLNLTQPGNPSTTGVYAYKAATQFVNSFATAAAQQTLTTAGTAPTPGGRPTYATTAGMHLDPSDIAGNVVTSTLMFSPIMEIMTGGTSPFWNKGGTMMQVSQNNPLADLANTGQWLLGIAAALVGVAIACFAAAGNQVVEFFGGGGGTIIGIIALALAGLMWGAGITLAYLLPLIPFIKFLFSIVGWLLNILEGIIAMPLVAIAHLNTKGDGLMPDMARSGYQLTLVILLKPALLIIGFAIAMSMFIVGIGILDNLWGAAIAGWKGAERGSIGPFGMLMYTIIYTAIAYGMANSSFQLIESIADRALAWISGASFPTVTGDEQLVHRITHNAGEGLKAVFIGNNAYQKLGDKPGGGGGGGSTPSGWGGSYIGGPGGNDSGGDIMGREGDVNLASDADGNQPAQRNSYARRNPGGSMLTNSMGRGQSFIPSADVMGDDGRPSTEGLSLADDGPARPTPDSGLEGEPYSPRIQVADSYRSRERGSGSPTTPPPARDSLGRDMGSADDAMARAAEQRDVNEAQEAAIESDAISRGLEDPANRDGIAESRKGGENIKPEPRFRTLEEEAQYQRDIIAGKGRSR